MDRDVIWTALTPQLSYNLLDQLSHGSCSGQTGHSRTPGITNPLITTEYTFHSFEQILIDLTPSSSVSYSLVWTVDCLVISTGPLVWPPLGRDTLWLIRRHATSMIPDGSPRGAGSPSHSAGTTAALTSERFAGLIILITGAHNVTDYAAAHKGRPQLLPPEVIIIIQFAGSFT